MQILLLIIVKCVSRDGPATSGSKYSAVNKKTTSDYMYLTHCAAQLTTNPPWALMAEPSQRMK